MPFLETFEAWSFRLFGKTAPGVLRRVGQFRDYLERAKIKIYPETYISLMFFTAVLTIPISIASIIIVLLYGFMPIIFLIPVPVYVMIGFLLVPISKASDRSTNLEREMPFAASYISVMASGGIAPYSSFKRLAEVDLLPGMKSEAREIIKDVEIFGIDPLTAIEQAAKKNPLDIFKDFLSGYASTVIIGGDIGHFLERKAEDIFKARALRVKAAAERLGMLLETFIIVNVMMSLCFYIMFSVENIGVSGTGSAGGGSTSGIILYTFLLSPMLSMMFIYLAHSMQPKTPVTDMRPYKVFAISGVVGISFFAIMYVFNLFGPIIDLPVALAIALFVATAPAAVVYHKYQSQRTQTEQGVNSFLRDLTEVRKTGLSPEKCIESLSRREYGTFSRELRKISAEISWGIPVRKVIMDFIKRTKSWMTQIVMFLLVETVDVGGGTIAMIESLARFNNLTHEVEKEKRMAVRPYVIMPYFAALLLVATTTMMLGFTTGTIGLGGLEGQANPAMEGVKAIFNLSCIFHSYMIGIVAGKISEESIGAGFKHASILVIITVVTAKLVPMFVKL
ncbi:MAG TPA: type II secretion system F family protein [Candidatus Bathyarchaeia archaeon]|nr:type II secretion system F family protein [Candidatus Bathyarchaeia archaeon]